MKKSLLLVLAAVTTLGLGAYGRSLYRYFSTDAAYEHLVALQPTSRPEVEAALPGFAGIQITDTREMNGRLAKELRPGAIYLRFEKYRDGGIDVVIDSEGRVRAIWPDYE